MQSDAIRSNQKEAGSCNQMQSDAIRCNQKQSDAIRCNLGYLQQREERQLVGGHARLDRAERLTNIRGQLGARGDDGLSPLGAL